MESDEVVILRVEGKTSDGECPCLCIGENEAARTRRKERVSGKGGSIPHGDVCIVSVEDAKPKKKKVPKGVNCPVTSGGFPPISVSNCDDIDLMEVEPSTSGSSSSTGVATKRPGTFTRQLNEDYLVAMSLHQTLNSKPTTSSSGDVANDGPISQDEELARSLQAKEYGILSQTENQDVSFVMDSKVMTDVPGPSSSVSLSCSPSGTSLCSSLLTKEVKPSPVNGQNPSNSNSKLHPLLRKHPKCWTECPNCPSDAIRKYHLINVPSDSAEWEIIANPLIQAGFHVTKVRGSIVYCRVSLQCNLDYQDPFAGHKIVLV